jgi:hypothetical protein
MKGVGSGALVLCDHGLWPSDLHTRAVGAHFSCKLDAKAGGKRRSVAGRSHDFSQITVSAPPTSPPYLLRSAFFSSRRWGAIAFAQYSVITHASRNCISEALLDPL